MRSKRRRVCDGMIYVAVVLGVLLAGLVQGQQISAGGGGYAVKLDGVDDYISLGSGPTGTPLTSFTVEAWIDPCVDGNTQQQTFISLVLPPAAGGRFEVGMESGLLRLLYSEGIIGELKVDLTGGIRHMALVVEPVGGGSVGSKVSWYLNGTNLETLDTASISTAITMPVDGVWNLGVASRPIFGGLRRQRAFCGAIDEVRVWKSARTQQQIFTNLYNELSNPAAEANLISYWKFNTGNGAKVVDSSVNNNQDGLFGDGVAFESPQWIPSRFPVKGAIIAATCRPGSAVWIGVRVGVTHNDASLGTVTTLPSCVTIVSGPQHGTLTTADHAAGTSLTAFPHTLGASSTMVLYNTSSSTADFGVVTKDSFKISICAGTTGASNPPTEHTVEIVFKGNESPISGINRALKLDGQNDYLAVSDFGSLPNGDALTLEFLMRPLSTYNNQNFIAKHKVGGTNVLVFGWWQEGYVLQVQGRSVRFSASRTLEERFISLRMEGVPSSTNPSLNDTRATLFINGVSTGTEVIPERVLGDVSGLPWVLGQEFDSGGLLSDFYLGEIDEVRAWDHLRSDAQILAHSKAPLSGTESGLYFYVNFDEMEPQDPSQPKVFTTSSQLVQNQIYPKAELLFGAHIVSGYGTVFERGSHAVTEVQAGLTSTVCVPFVDKDDDAQAKFQRGIVSNNISFWEENMGNAINVAAKYTLPASSTAGSFSFADPPISLIPSMLKNPSTFSSLKSVCFNYTAPAVFDETQLSYQVFDFAKSSTEPAQLLIRTLTPGPRLVSARATDQDDADPSYNEGDQLRFEFDADTNQPNGTSVTEIGLFLKLSCDFGSVLSGIWESPRLFSVSIVEADAIPAPFVNGSCTAKVTGSLLRDAAQKTYTITTDDPLPIVGTWGKEAEESDTLSLVVIGVLCGTALAVVVAFVLLVFLIIRRRSASGTHLCLDLSELGDIKFGSNIFVVNRKSSLSIIQVVEDSRKQLIRQHVNASLKGAEVMLFPHTFMSEGHSGKLCQAFIKQRCNFTHRNVLRMSGYIVHDKYTAAKIYLNDLEREAWSMSLQENMSIWGVYESCANLTLEHVINSPVFLKEVLFVGSICYDISNGMKYLHSNNVVHGNLSTVTCFVTQSWTVKVSDFGFRDIVNLFPDDNGASMEHATIRCLEFSFDAGESVTRDFEGDVYSFGKILNGIMKKLLRHKETEEAKEHSEESDRSSAARIMSKTSHLSDYRPHHVLSGLFKSANDIAPDAPAGTKVGEDVFGALKIISAKCTQGMLSSNAQLSETYSDNLVLSTLRSQRPKFSWISEELVKILPLLASGTMIEVVLSLFNKKLESLVKKRTKEVLEAKARVEDVLHELLPPSIAKKLINNEQVEPSFYDSVTIFFSDIVDFTSLSAESTPFDIVNLLNDMYSLFDSLIASMDVYKVETIGDSYMVVSGLPQENGQMHANNIVSMGLIMIYHIQTFKVRHRPNHVLQLRAGCHSGSVAAGIVGVKMPRFCLFGDTVNTASRMESNGLPNRLHCSQETVTILQNHFGQEMFEIEDRGAISVKGKGEVQTFFVNSKKGLFDENGTGSRKANVRTSLTAQYPLISDKNMTDMDEELNDLMQTTEAEIELMGVQP
eukprot:Nk52_evm7s379 gene=Nk52_evmTU7s379